jgi:cobalt-zinc-cadmium efflux system outer membrane protein
LDQAISEAIQKNLDLAAERLNVSVAQAREITARLRPNPVLTVQAQTINVFRANYTSDSTLGPNQINVHTDLPIERAGKRDYRIGLAQAQKSLAELGVREVMRQVIFNVQTAYVDVQQAKNNLALAQENLRSLEGVVTVNEARANSGDLAQVELDRSRVAALQYRTAVQQAQLQLDQAKSQLQFLMGRIGRDPSFDVQGDLRRDTLMDAQPDLVRKAVALRPDYLSGIQTQATSQADLRLQLANGRVDWVVGSEYTHQSAGGFSGSSMGFSFSMPLRVFNKNQGEIARAERELALAGARRTALEASINQEVERAYRQYTVSRQLLTDVETNMLMRARSVRDITEYSYRRGEATLVEFLDAQRAFNDAMQTFNDARAGYARSLYLIDTVSGETVSGT